MLRQKLTVAKRGVAGSIIVTEHSCNGEGHFFLIFWEHYRRQHWRLSKDTNSLWTTPLVWKATTNIVFTFDLHISAFFGLGNAKTWDSTICRFVSESYTNSHDSSPILMLSKIHTQFQQVLKYLSFAIVTPLNFYFVNQLNIERSHVVYHNCVPSGYLKVTINITLIQYWKSTNHAHESHFRRCDWLMAVQRENCHPFPALLKPRYPPWNLQR